MQDELEWIKTLGSGASVAALALYAIKNLLAMLKESNDRHAELSKTLPAIVSSNTEANTKLTGAIEELRRDLTFRSTNGHISNSKSGERS
jgi:hypothetical protein